MTNKEMERFWKLYLEVGIRKRLSLTEFCSICKIPYEEFEGFLKRRRDDFKENENQRNEREDAKKRLLRIAAAYDKQRLKLMKERKR